jgi:hypothetical protein
VLGDPATSAGLVVTLWESPEAVAAYVRSGQWAPVLAPFAAVLAAPPSVPEGYDVLYTAAQ